MPPENLVPASSGLARVSAVQATDSREGNRVSVLGRLDIGVANSSLNPVGYKLGFSTDELITNSDTGVATDTALGDRGWFGTQGRTSIICSSINYATTYPIGLRVHCADDGSETYEDNKRHVVDRLTQNMSSPSIMNVSRRCPSGARRLLTRFSTSGNSRFRGRFFGDCWVDLEGQRLR